GGAKAQFDPVTGDIPRAQLSGRGTVDGYSLSANYIFIGENDDLGTTQDRHEVAVNAEIPLADYWTAKAGIAWDLATSQWLQTTAGITYDDKYLAFGVETRMTGATHRDEDEFRIGVNFRLRGPQNQDVIDFGYSFSEF